VVVSNNKEGPSFSEEKEAKRLLSIGPERVALAVRQRIKVFWFFFPKKNNSSLRVCPRTLLCTT
jgi:hypothetical protein